MKSIARSARRLPVVRPSGRDQASSGLSWIHDGVRHRVTHWPEVDFEREVGPDEWVADEPGESVLASAALGITAAQWRRYLEFVPAAEREFLAHFPFGRLAALQVIARCPALLPTLREMPALTPFLTTHLSLRGGKGPGWREIGAVFERDGIHGVLQWLGLPASRQTLAVLQAVADPDLPRRLLEPLRAALWEPEAIRVLIHGPALTDERIAAACHALAA